MLESRFERWNHSFAGNVLRLEPCAGLGENCSKMVHLRVFHKNTIPPFGESVLKASRHALVSVDPCKQ